MKKKKRCWATAHFQHALGHDTTICIVTQRLGRLAWAQPGGHDKARTWPRHDRACATIWPLEGHDTASS